jgi:uncharacterized membrane protein YhhN
VAATLLNWRGKLHQATKMLIMPPLFLYYLLFAPQPEAPIAAAIILAWTGDFFLMRLSDGEPVAIMPGIICYFGQNILYTLSVGIWGNPEFRSTWVVICLCAVTFALAVRICIGRLTIRGRKPGRLLSLGAALYSATLALFIGEALSGAIFLHNMSAWFLFIGSVLFTISDMFLAFVSFPAPSKKKDVVVMTTYSIAQALIVIGFTL